MQGGDSDPMSFGKEQDNDDSPDSSGKKEAMGDKGLLLTNQLSSSTISPYWLYEFTWHKFEKLSRCQGWILQSVVSAKPPRKRRSGCKS